ncbi:hypothetical protein FF1_043750 [Malus domestica]
MVIWTRDAKREPFRPNEDKEEILEPEVLYLSTIGALLYLAQCTRPDISFAVNLLARYSNVPTCKHWNSVKDILRYLKGSTDLGLAIPSVLGFILALLVTQMLDIYLAQLRHVLKWAMSLPLETPLYLKSLPSKH